MPASNAGVTEARRRLILWALWVHGAGNPASITELLKAHNVTWPQADWHGSVPRPYEAGTRQHLDAMRSRNDGRVRFAAAPRTHPRLYEWNPDVLTPRANAQEVLELRRQGQNPSEVTGLSKGLVSALYHDPFGLAEKERKTKYCAACGAPKEDAQTMCTGCVRKARLAREDHAESLLPDRTWALSLPVLMPVDFTVTDDGRRVLVVHTERGKFDIQLCRGESWEHAVAEAGVLR